MPEPIIPNAYRTLVVQQGASGLPEDLFVNNVYWIDSGAGGTFDTEGVAIEAERLLTDFFTTAGPGGFAVGAWLAQPQRVFLKTYHLGDSTPRIPVVSDDLPWTFDAASDELPREVAVVNSFRSAVKGPRGRGRFYLGPLTVAAMQTTVSPVRVKPGFITAIIEASQAMAADNAAITWGQYSPSNAQVNPVTGGFVDDAFDTQRSRGAAPTGRSIWPAAA